MSITEKLQLLLAQNANYLGTNLIFIEHSLAYKILFCLPDSQRFSFPDHHRPIPAPKRPNPDIHYQISTSRSIFLIPCLFSISKRKREFKKAFHFCFCWLLKALPRLCLRQELEGNCCRFRLSPQVHPFKRRAKHSIASIRGKEALTKTYYRQNYIQTLKTVQLAHIIKQRKMGPISETDYMNKTGGQQHLKDWYNQAPVLLYCYRPTQLPIYN